MKIRKYYSLEKLGEISPSFKVRGVICFEYEDPTSVVKPPPLFTRERTLEDWFCPDLFGGLLISYPSRQNFEIDENLSEVLSDISELTKCFRDVQQRQVAFSKLKFSIRSLQKKLNLESREYLRVLNMCLDALQNIKAEQIKREQIHSLEFVLKTLVEDLSEHTVNELQKILFKSGLKPIPDLEGIAELYP